MKKILVVEDEGALIKPLIERLEEEGFGVVLAKDGQEGLDFAAQEHPDLILLDVIMPKMDGITMLKTLRETNDWGKNVPVILLTNLSNLDKGGDNENFEKFISENLAYYLVKTRWTLDDIVERVKEVLKI